MDENVPNVAHYTDSLRSIIAEASAAVMNIYQQDFSVREKQDKSPLTEADIAAHRIIISGLSAIASFPVLSEEGSNISWSERKCWDEYWLVDPIDGTKEFIKKNGEFTINIALISCGSPVLGIVSAPAKGVTFFGAQNVGAWKESNKGVVEAIKPKRPPRSEWKIVGSRSHNSDAAIQLAESLPGSKFVSMGSSLKLCSVAEGKADIYPRFGPTSEWDTAAAQAVVEASGGKVLTLDLMPLRYNAKESLLNPYFIVCSDIDAAWADSIRALSFDE